MKKVVGILAVVMFIVSVMSIGSAKAFDQITAQEAYDMVKAGDAQLIDIRTTAEYLWVGTCKLQVPKPETDPVQYEDDVPYNIPWKIWAGEIAETDGKYEAGGIVVKRLFRRLITRTFPRNSTLILMCRSGKRTSDAAEYLETKLRCKNYTVYEIDNPNKNGRGGFQGSSSNCPPYVTPDGCPTDNPESNYAVSGYRGWPGRVKNLANLRDPDWVPGDEDESSVSWMDTGLPMTQKVDKDKIWKYMWGW